MIPENKLTGAERVVLAAFRAGDPTVNVDRAEIRGDFLRGLFLGGYDEKADYHGTRIVGAVIPDALDMGFCETKFPVRLHESFFAQKIKLQHLTCPGMDFSSCNLKEGLDARMMRAAGSVELNNTSATAIVGLAGADIGGQLVCLGGRFQNQGGNAFHATGIKVAIDVFLCGHFNGEVNLSGADIGGQLSCRGGIFQNRAGNAINAQDIKVSGIVFLADGFSAEGAINLLGADIGGQLVCKGGNFQNKYGYALNAQNMKVIGDAVLCDGFCAEGAVSLAGAEIGGQFDCTGGNFQNDGNVALNARNIKSANEAIIRNLSANGQVSFANATIGGDLMLDGCKLTGLSLSGANVLGKFQDDADAYKLDEDNRIDLNIDGFRYQRLGDVKERVEGRLAWVGAAPLATAINRSGP